MRKYNILLVEDSESDAALLEAMLFSVKNFDCSLDHVALLTSATDKLRARNYDAVISDLGLPDSSGLGTYEGLRAEAPHTPIIIVSGNDDRDVLTKALNQGADNYLIKGSYGGDRVAVAILSGIRNRAIGS